MVPTAPGSAMAEGAIMQEESIYDSATQNTWLHDGISKAGAEKLLKSRGIGAGTFLVRASESRPGDLALSVSVGKKVVHCAIDETEGQGFSVRFEGAVWFPTLAQVIDHYRVNPLGGVTTKEGVPINLGLGLLATEVLEADEGDDEVWTVEAVREKSSAELIKILKARGVDYKSFTSKEQVQDLIITMMQNPAFFSP